MDKHFIYVCVKCNLIHNSNKKSSGQKLLEKIQDLLQRHQFLKSISCKPVSCMNACKKPCTVGFSARNKVSYLFGYLNADHAGMILVGAALYVKKPDGIIKKSERPECLKESVLARIPVLE